MTAIADDMIYCECHEGKPAWAYCEWSMSKGTQRANLCRECVRDAIVKIDKSKPYHWANLPPRVYEKN